MLGKPPILNSNLWKAKIVNFQCLEKTRFLIPVIGKGHKNKF